MATNTAMPSGYDYEFVQEVLEDYICIICRLAMRNPVQTRCGHQYCKECLEEAYKRKPNICPIDQGLLTPHDIFPNKFWERKILSLEIKCPHQGCDWQGELRDLIEQSHENRCDYKVVECDNEGCSVRKSRCEMVGHVQDECQYRIVPCPLCKNTYTFCLLEEHTSECPKCPGICPNDCGKTSVKREEVTSHLLDECPLTIVPCSYQNIGCTFTVQRKLLNDHIDNHVKQHLDIAMEKIVSIQNQTVIAIEANRHQTTIAIESMKKQMDEMKKQIPSTKTIEGIQKQMNEMKKQIPPIKTIEGIQKQMNQMENQMDDIHYSYVWKVKDFSMSTTRNSKAADSNTKIYSEPFYTHKYGYKLKLQLYPKGHGVGKGTHVSVFLIVMRGDYDAMLTWPFDWKVKFILVDQKPNASQRRNFENGFTPDKSLPNYQRPTTNQNPGRGPAQFVSHEILATEKYVVDNTLFLKLVLEKRT